MNSSIIQIFLSALEPSDEKQPGLIISCKLYPFYSWKVYMENKNSILIFIPLVHLKIWMQGRKKKDFLNLGTYAKKRPI